MQTVIINMLVGIEYEIVSTIIYDMFPPKTLQKQAEHMKSTEHTFTKLIKGISKHVF